MVDHLDRLLEGEQTGQVMRGHFAGAVADNGIRSDPELRELLGQARPGWRSWPVARSPSPPCEILLSSRRSSSRSDQSVYRDSSRSLRSDAVGECGEDVEQPTAHPPPLRAHAGTDEREFRCGGVDAAGGDLPAVGEGLKLFSRLGDAVGDHGVPMVQVSASLAERVPQIRQRDIGVRGQVPGQPTGRGDQCLLAAGRDRQDGRRPRRAGDLRPRRRPGGRLGEHHVGVGAPESERVHSDDAPLAGGERPSRGGYVDLEIRRSDTCRVGFCRCRLAGM